MCLKLPHKHLIESQGDEISGESTDGKVFQQVIESANHRMELHLVSHQHGSHLKIFKSKNG